MSNSVEAYAEYTDREIYDGLLRRDSRMPVAFDQLRQMLGPCNLSPEEIISRLKVGMDFEWTPVQEHLFLRAMNYMRGQLQRQRANAANN
jgi:hypothetical protein